MILYLLVLTDPELSYEGYSEDFEIGIFLTEQQAQETAQYYLENIRGFCDFPCTYRIVKKRLLTILMIVFLRLSGLYKVGISTRILMRSTL